MEASNLPDTEFKTLVLRMHKKTQNYKKDILRLNKDIETIKKQSEVKNTINWMKNTLEEINSKSD